MSKLTKIIPAAHPLRPNLNRSLGLGDTWSVIICGCPRHDGTAANRNWSGQTHYALNLILEGRGHLQPADSPPLPLQPGTAYQHFPAPAAAPALHWSEGQDIAEWFITLDRRLYDRLAPTGLFPSEPILHFTHPDPAGLFTAYYNRIDTLGTTSTPRRLHRMLAETVYFLGCFFDTARPPESTSRWTSLVNQARDWFDLNPASREPLPALARRLGVSYASLRREFQNATGQSLTTYRIARRIEAAKARLALHDIAATAAHLGYPDPFTFSTQFKQVTGQSPRAYLQGTGSSDRLK